MKKYLVTGSATISISTVVEAQNEEEAVAIAEGRGMCSLMDPNRMGSCIEDVWFHSGEIDATAENIEVQEELE